VREVHEHGFALQVSLHSNQQTDLSTHGTEDKGFVLSSKAIHYDEHNQSL
jgi:hypothetical protein